MYSRCEAKSTEKPTYGTAMQAVQKPFDHPAGHQFQVLDTAGNAGRRESERSSRTGRRQWPAGGCIIGRAPGRSDAADDFVGVDAFGPGVEVQHQPMPQHGHGHGSDVVKIDVEPPQQQGPRLGPQDQVLRGPRAGAVANVAVHVVALAGRAISGRE